MKDLLAGEAARTLRINRDAERRGRPDQHGIEAVLQIVGAGEGEDVRLTPTSSRREPSGMKTSESATMTA